MRNTLYIAKRSILELGSLEKKIADLVSDKIPKNAEDILNEKAVSESERYDKHIRNIKYNMRRKETQHDGNRSNFANHMISLEIMT